MTRWETSISAFRSFLARISTRITSAQGAVCFPAVVAAPSLVATDIDIVGLVLTIVLLLFSLGFHEAAHAWVALKCGDSTGKDLGRITLNPIPHIDPMMSIILPAILYWSTGGRFVFGGARPVPVNFHRLRNPLRDMSLVALAGPLSNLLLAVIFILGWKFFVATGLYKDAAALAELRVEDRLPQLMEHAALFNVVLAVFNLVPIPPLDGSRVMSWLLPVGLRSAYDGLERFGLLIIILLSYFSPPFQSFVSEAVRFVIGKMETIVSLGGRW